MNYSICWLIMDFTETSRQQFPAARNGSRILYLYPAQKRGPLGRGRSQQRDLCRGRSAGNGGRINDLKNVKRKRMNSHGEHEQHRNQKRGSALRPEKNHPVMLNLRLDLGSQRGKSTGLGVHCGWLVAATATEYPRRSPKFITLETNSYGTARSARMMRERSLISGWPSISSNSASSTRLSWK